MIQQPTIIETPFSIIVFKCVVENGVVNKGDTITARPYDYIVTNIVDNGDTYTITILAKLSHLKLINNGHRFTTQGDTTIQVVSINSIIP